MEFGVTVFERMIDNLAGLGAVGANEKNGKGMWACAPATRLTPSSPVGHGREFGTLYFRRAAQRTGQPTPVQ
jgi:hypothetical protein